MQATTLSMAAAATSLTSEAATDTKQPDILLIMPDQMRGDCLSIANHPVVKTPNLDALAREGALFRRAYSTVASCIPARYALLTGIFPQTSGVVGFRAKPFETPTLPGLLAQQGYATVLVGRNMHQPDASGNSGYTKRILGSTYVSDDDYDHFLRHELPESGGIRNVVKRLGITFNHWQANPWPYDNRLHPTTWTVDQSRAVIADSGDARPLFLTTSFYAPHPPLFPPTPLFNAYSEVKLPSPAHGDWVKWDQLSTNGDKQGHRIKLEGERLRKTQAGYFGLIEHIDREIAPLIADFKERSRRAGRPWVIVVTSDHGEMLGDHGYFRKCEPFEGSANIPLIVAASPELHPKPGTICHRPTCLEDIMPTLLEAAGVGIPGCVDGCSLLPVVQGSKHKIRDWLHFEHAPCYSQEQAYHALTDGRHKYIWRPTDGSEHLFDLDSDPQEEHDLAREAAAADKLDIWRQRMADRLAPRPEGFSDGEKLIPGRPYRPLNAGMLKKRKT